jgi:hypothetical protein
MADPALGDDENGVPFEQLPRATRCLIEILRELRAMHCEQVVFRQQTQENFACVRRQLALGFQLPPISYHGGGLDFPTLTADPNTEENSMAQYTIEADRPDQPYTITPPTGATDSEGNVIPVGTVALAPKSDNESVISFVPSTADPLTGMIHFGAPNADGSPATATVTLEARDAGNDDFLGIVGTPDTFIIHPGTIAAITGGGMTYPTLTPDAVTPV